MEDVYVNSGDIEMISTTLKQMKDNQSLLIESIDRLSDMVYELSIQVDKHRKYSNR